MAICFGKAVESVTNFLNAHTSKEYLPLKRFLVEDLQVAAEGFGANKPSSALNSKYVAYLLGRVNRKLSKIDFGNIVDTRGNITKWDKYQNITQIISLHTKLCPNDTNDKNSSYSRVIGVNTFLLNQRADFEYGFKTNNEFIMTVYQTLALDLICLTSMLMVEQIRCLTSSDGGSLSGKIASKSLSNKMNTLNKNTDTLMSVLNDGSWAKVVRAYKDMRVKPQMSMESVGAVVSIIATIALIGAVGAISIVAIVSAIRGIIYLYYSSLAKIDEQARSMEEYLKEITPYETNPEALKKQQKAMTKLSNIAGFIEAKLIKADISATTEIKSEDSKVTLDNLEMSNGNSFDFY